MAWKRLQTTFWRTSIYVLWFRLMEKIFNDAFSGTQRTAFVQLFGYSNADASSLSSVFGTIAFLTPLLGGWLGKYIIAGAACARKNERSALRASIWVALPLTISFHR